MLISKFGQPLIPCFVIPLHLFRKGSHLLDSSCPLNPPILNSSRRYQRSSSLSFYLSVASIEPSSAQGPPPLRCRGGGRRSSSSVSGSSCPFPCGQKTLDPKSNYLIQYIGRRGSRICLIEYSGHRWDKFRSRRWPTRSSSGRKRGSIRSWRQCCTRWNSLRNEWR